jgi:hypothetical protein
LANISSRKKKHLSFQLGQRWNRLMRFNCWFWKYDGSNFWVRNRKDKNIPFKDAIELKQSTMIMFLLILIQL